MDMQISLKVDKPEKPVRHMNGVPVYPMGHDISLTAEFVNKGKDNLSIEDPQTSQKVLLWFLPEDETDEIVFELNPGTIDVTGERTAPITSDIQLGPKESISVSIEFNKYCGDRCFSPGKYELYIEFMEIKSPRLEYGIEFCPQSVPNLIAITINEDGDKWFREESLLWLQKLPEKPDIKLAVEGETDDQKTVRETRNRENARLYLEKWHVQQETETIRDFFENIRLK